MLQTTDIASPRKGGHIFYFATITLLLGAIVVALIQKRCESTVAIAGATKGNAQQIIQDAKYWAITSLVAVALAILSWGIAIWRREKHRGLWVCVVVFLALYVLLELMMV